jgi:hypothetical protein
VIGGVGDLDISDQYCQSKGYDGAADDLTYQELLDIRDAYTGNAYVILLSKIIISN